MSELVNSLLSPSWWIGVVVVSFAINLASAYAKAPLDRVLNRLSARRQRKSKRAQLEIEIASILETAKRQKDGVVLLSIHELRLVVICTTVVLCILLLLLVMLQPSPNNVGLPLVLLVPGFLFAALMCFQQARKIESVDYIRSAI